MNSNIQDEISFVSVAHENIYIRKIITKLNTVDPEINAIILLIIYIMQKMQVNITHLFLAWLEQYFYLLANTFKQLDQQPLHLSPPLRYSNKN